MKKILFITVIALLIVSSVSFTGQAIAQAGAMSTQEMEVLILKLQAQVAQLQAQLSTATLQRTMGRGSRGEDVKQLQISLGVSPTGFYGVMTEAAVRKLQIKNGLEAVGVVGPKTLKILNARPTSSSVAPVATQSPTPISVPNPTPTPTATSVTPTPTQSPTPTPAPTPATAPAPSGIINGQIYIDPNCSSGICSSASYTGPLTVKAQASNGTEYSTNTGISVTNFSITGVAAGIYSVNAFPANSSSLTCTATTAVVSANQTVTADVRCK